MRKTYTNRTDAWMPQIRELRDAAFDLYQEATAKNPDYPSWEARRWRDCWVELCSASAFRQHSKVAAYLNEANSIACRER